MENGMPRSRGQQAASLATGKVSRSFATSMEPVLRQVLANRAKSPSCVVNASMSIVRRRTGAGRIRVGHFIESNIDSARVPGIQPMVSRIERL